LSSAHPVESLYHDHHSWLTGWLRRRLGCPDSAADLAQDTFIRVLSAREPAAIIEPRAFLTTLAKRVLFNHYRRQDLERAYLETWRRCRKWLRHRKKTKRSSCKP
jgi:RNA polymerase sigma-70 factor (ECF subfamily)